MEDYVSFEQALRLKELGFDWKVNHSYCTIDKSFEECKSTPAWESGPTDTAYSNLNKLGIYLSAPTLSQVSKWLYIQHGIWIEIMDYSTLNPAWKFKYSIVASSTCEKVSENENYENPFVALSAGLTKALELLK